MRHTLPLATLFLLASCAGRHTPRPVTPDGVPLTAAPTEAQTAQQREKAAAILTQVASTPTPDPVQSALRANAFEGLLPMPGRLEPILRAALADQSVGIRAVAAMAAGKARIRTLTDALQPLTRDESSLVRSAAAFALARAGEPADLNLLAQMLASADTQPRAHAAFVLGELGNPSAIPMLVQALNTPQSRTDAVKDRLMRLQINEAIIKLARAGGGGGTAGGGYAVDIEARLNEVRLSLWPTRAEDLEPCALACQILGQLRDAGAAPQLAALAADRYQQNASLPLEIRLAAADALLRMGSNAGNGIELAAASLHDQSPTVRALAAAALGDTRDTRHLANLEQLFTDPDTQARIAAAAATIKVTDAR